MELNEQQYRRVGRYLDGASVELTPDEQKVADDIRRIEIALRGRVEVTPPRSALDPARRRMLGELVHPRRRVRWILWPAAVAAIVLIAAAPWFVKPAPPDAGPIGEEITMTYPGQNEDIGMDLIAEELQMLEAEITVSLLPAPLETQLDDLQESLSDFWIEETPNWADEG